MIRTSSRKKGHGRGRGGVGGAQDGDGLGSSVREHFGAGVPTVEGEGRTLGAKVEGDTDDELSRLLYETKLRQLMTKLVIQAHEITVEEDPTATKQSPKFSDIIDNILNNEYPSGITNLVDKMRDKVKVSKISDIIEELEVNPYSDIERGIAELLERTQPSSGAGSDDFVVTDGSDGWKVSSQDTIEGILRAARDPIKPPTRSRKAKAPDEL
jgi:hypothetical protein